jgi:uncharacterized protein
MASPNPLSEDEIDDLLYYSRINDLGELEAALADIVDSKHLTLDLPQIIAAAVDPEDGNTALHYAAANNHLGNGSVQSCA